MLQSESRATGEDRISDLPDGVLLHILSFLQMVDAYSTNFLSNRWRGLWALVVDMDFLCSSPRRTEMIGDFPAFIDRLIHLHRGLRIHKLQFSIGYRESNQDTVDGWVEFAVARGVEVLDMDFLNGLEYFVAPPYYRLLGCLFNCSSLKVLKVCYFILSLLPATICFSSLQTLILRLVECDEYDTLKDLVARCPLLENLTLDDFNGVGFPTVDVSVSNPNLRHLKITDSFDNDGFSENLKIDAPNLLSLEFTGCLARSCYLMGNLKSLVSVSFHLVNMTPHLAINKEFGDQVFVELLNKFGHVRDLSLCSYCMQIFSFRLLEKKRSFITPFSGVRLLELKIGMVKLELPGLIYVLQEIRNLESLIITIGSWCETDAKHNGNYNINRSFKRSLENSSLGLSVYLKTIEIRGFGETEHALFEEIDGLKVKDFREMMRNETWLVTFFLRKSLALEKMILKGRWSRRPEELHCLIQWLFSLPRSSPCAEIVLLLSCK